VNGTFIVIKEHNGHQTQNINETLVRAFRDVLKRRASSEYETSRHVYEEEARKYIIW